MDKNVAISESDAVDVSRKFAFETITSADDLGEGETGFARPLSVLDESELWLIDLPRIGVNGNSSVLLASTIWATFSKSTPTSFCKARIVARCSGGYSRSRYLTSEWSARYVSRWGMMRVARRYEFVKGLSEV